MLYSTTQILKLVRTTSVALVAAATIMATFPATARSAEAPEQQQLVEKARLTMEAFAADSHAGAAVRDLKGSAKALYIVPQVLRGAFIFGGAGGSGVLLVRDDKTGQGRSRPSIRWDRPVSGFKSAVTYRRWYWWCETGRVSRSSTGPTSSSGRTRQLHWDRSEKGPRSRG